MGRGCGGDVRGGARPREKERGESSRRGGPRRLPPPRSPLGEIPRAARGHGVARVVRLGRRSGGVWLRSRAAPPLPSPRPSPLATPGLRPVGAARAGPRPGAACPGGGPRDAAAPPAAARFRPPPGRGRAAPLLPRSPRLGRVGVEAGGGSRPWEGRRARGRGRRGGRVVARGGGRGRRGPAVGGDRRDPTTSRRPPARRPAPAPPLSPRRAAPAPRLPPPSARLPRPPWPGRAPRRRRRLVLPRPGSPPRGAPSPLVLGSLSRPRGDSRARVRARALRDATSDQTWRPAEFKHISQRRKRN